MEQNTLFKTVLLNIGFDVYMSGSRVADSTGDFSGLTHCVNIVTIAEKKYAVDVGFGSNGPISPLEMNPEGDSIASHLGETQMRLHYGSIAQALNQRAKIWIYEHKIDPKGDWTVMYCFPDFEIIPQDVKVMNLGPSKSPTSIFVQRVITTLFLADGDVAVDDGKLTVPQSQELTDGPLTGQLILDNNIFKFRSNGEKKYEITLKSERERVEILEKNYGLELGEADRKAIKGTSTEIKE